PPAPARPSRNLRRGLCSCWTSSSRCGCPCGAARPATRRSSASRRRPRRRIRRTRRGRSFVAPPMLVAGQMQLGHWRVHNVRELNLSALRRGEIAGGRRFAVPIAPYAPAGLLALRFSRPVMAHDVATLKVVRLRSIDARLLLPFAASDQGWRLAKDEIV